MITGTLDVSMEIQPYPGLRPFREDETHLYFGREQHRGEILKRLAVTRFVAVIGTSGSGKSSLVRAGLLPDLLSGYLAGSGSDWVMVECTPGADPLGRLAASLLTVGWATDATALRTNSSEILDLAGQHLTPGQHLLVLVDQFEELFRLKTSEDPAEDADEKAAFVRLLLNAGGQRADVPAQHLRVHVVMAMRSEFLGRASVYHGLPEAIDQGQYLIPRLSREQLRKAVESPARVAGGEVDEALVQCLLNELGDDQDQLPVLQHSLMRCWQFRDAENRIGPEVYEKSGRLASALSLDANEALAETRTSLGGRGEEIVKRAFQALRETDVHGGQARRPTTVHDLRELAGCSTDELTTALAPFRARSFVVPSEGLLESSTLIDISHEALFRRWDTLKRWIDEDDRDRTRYVRLATRAAEEQDSERPQYLVPPPLDLLLKFWADRNPQRAWALRHHKGYEPAKAFLDQSERHRRDLEREEANHQEEEAQRNRALADEVARRARTRRRAIAGSVVASVLLLGSGLLYWNALEEGSRREALLGRLEALLITARLASVPEANVEARLQLAAEAARRRQDVESREELLKTLLIALMPKEAGGLPQLGGSVGALAMSPSDQQLYAVAGDRLRGIEVATGRERFNVPLSGFPGGDDGPVLLASGEKLIVIKEKTVSVVDGGTGRLLASPMFEAGAFTASADGTAAAFLVSDTVVLCDLATNCQSQARHAVPGLSPSDLELSADGKLLAVIGARTGQDVDPPGRQVVLFDTRPWKQRSAAAVSDDDVLAMGVNSRYLHLCTPGSLRQYDVYDDTLDERDLLFPGEAVTCRFSAGGIVTSHDDGAIRVWDQMGVLLSQAFARVDNVWRLALGGRTLVAADDRGVQAWDITPYGRRNAGATLLGFVRENAYAYGEGQLVALDSGEIAAGPKFGPPGRIPEAVSESLGLAVFRSAQGITLEELRPGQDPVERWSYDIGSPLSPLRRPEITISGDDRHVAIALGRRNQFDYQRRGSDYQRRGSSALDASSIVILDARSTKIPRVVTTLKDKSSVFFGPADEVLAFDDSTVEIISLKGGAKPKSLDIQRQPNSPASAAFTRNGRLLAVAEPGDETTMVKLFEWPALTIVGRLPHPANVTSLSFALDGRTLATSTTEGTTHVWNLETQDEVLRIPPPTQGPSERTRAVFTPKGQIAILDNGELTVLPADPDLWLLEACRRIVRNLTPEQWALFVGDDIAYQRTCASRP